MVLKKTKAARESLDNNNLKKIKNGVKKMKRTTLLILTLIFSTVIVFAVSHANAGGGCDDISTTGSVWVDAAQDMFNMTDIPSCYNYVNTTDLGDQSIQGCGIGDSLITVSAGAYLGQEAPYDTGEIVVPHGTVFHTGNSVMEIIGEAGTGPFCHEFSLDLSSERESNTNNVIGANLMKSLLDSVNNFSADIFGAPGTTGFSVNIHAIDNYEIKATDDRLQTGQTEIKISGGSFE